MEKEFTTLSVSVVYDEKTHKNKPFVEVEEHDKSIVISYTFAPFRLDDRPPVLVAQQDWYSILPKEETNKATRIRPGEETKKTTLIKIEGAGFYAENGKPLLPSFGRFLSIPVNHSLVGKKVETCPEEVLPYEGQLPAAQESLVDESDGELRHGKRRNGSYQGHYPDKLVEVIGPFKHIDEYYALLIYVRPIRYVRKEKKLMGYRWIRVTLQFKEEAAGGDKLCSIDTFRDRKAFGNLFLNPSRKTSESTPDPAQENKGAEFLIIYGKGLRKAAEKLSWWKNRRGIKTEIVSASLIVQKAATQKAKREKIKRFIRKERKEPSPLRYVLLLGGIDLIPSQKTRDAAVPGVLEGGNVTDLYYATEFDFDENMNPYVFPWLAIGRIPVSQPKSVMRAIKAIIDYEKEPPQEPGYYNNFIASLVQSNRGYVETVESVASFLKEQRFKVKRIYDIGDTGHWALHDKNLKKAIFEDPRQAHNKVVQEIGRGRALITFRGHGDATGWKGPLVTTDHINKRIVDAPPHPSAIFSIACSSGDFDSKEQAFTTVLLKKGIAASLIAATRNSNTWLNNNLTKALYDALFGGFLPTFGERNNKPSYPLKNSRLARWL